MTTKGIKILSHASISRLADKSIDYCSYSSSHVSISFK